MMLGAGTNKKKKGFTIFLQRRKQNLEMEQSEEITWETIWTDDHL